MWLMGTAENFEVVADRGFSVNKGALCVKGWTSVETVPQPKRLLSPLARNNSVQLVPVSWDEGLSRVTTAFQSIQSAYGKAAVGIFGGGSLSKEKTYLLGKFAWVGLGSCVGVCTPPRPNRGLATSASIPAPVFTAASPRWKWIRASS